MNLVISLGSARAVELGRHKIKVSMGSKANSNVVINTLLTENMKKYVNCYVFSTDK